MASKDVCAHCNKALATVEEIHSVEGALYCSKSCAVNNQAEIIMQSACDTALEWYEAGAEIVIPADIGIK